MFESDNYTYKVECRGRTFYTNSRKRWRKHFKATKRRGIAGLYFRWAEANHWRTPQYLAVKNAI